MARLRSISTLLMFSALATGPAWAQDNDEIPVHDLGQREIGQQYTLKLTAVNVNCENPQDFEFEIDNMPWLNTNGPAIVPGLGPGQSKTIPAQMDFQYTPAGTYYGRVTSRCITCGWFIFATCVDQGQDIVMKVTVVDPQSQDQSNQNTRNPYAGFQPEIRTTVTMVDPLSDENIKHLTREQREALERARAAVVKAESDGKKAQDKLRNAQKKKSDCERELARLKAEADAAKAASDAAKTDQKTKDKAAKKAQKLLDDFEKDEKKALKKVEDTKNAVLVAADYRGQVEAKDGTGTGRFKRAQEQVDRFNEDHFDALREHTKVVNSQKARKAAAQAAIKAAAAAKAAAEKAKTAADKAKAAYEAKLKICLGLSDDVSDAEDDVSDAKDDAEDAVDNGNDAETKAAGQAADNLEDKIKKKEKHCKDLQKKQREEIKKVKEAKEAGAKIKMLDDTGGSAGSKKMREVNDKIWDEARDMLQDNTVLTVNDKGERGIGNDDSQDLISKDTAEDLANRVISGLGWVGQGAADLIGKGSNIPGGVQAPIISGLKTLGLAVQGQVNALRNPNSMAAQRSIALQDTPYMHGELKRHGYKNPAEVYDLITKLHNNRNYEADMIERHVREAAKCVTELKKLKAQLAAAKATAKQK